MKFEEPDIFDTEEERILLCSCGCRCFKILLREDGEIIAKCNKCKNIKYIKEEV
jgi:hypothetical protein